MLDMLIFGAHPDDAEIGAGGTIHRHVQAGLRVGICDLTRAELSSNGSVKLRAEEASQAAAILGLSYRSNLGMPDRGLSICKEQIDLITLEIRKLKPKIILAPYWKDRHPDHILCSQLVQEAVFNAKLKNYLPDSTYCIVENVYFYFINDIFEPDLMIDISENIDCKMKALDSYRSQFESSSESEDYVVTPLNQGYLENVKSRDRLLGQKRMLQYAEGFITKLPYVVDKFMI